MKKRVRSATELQGVIEEELAALCGELNADAVTMHLYDELRNEFFFSVGVGLYNKDRFRFSAPSMDRVAGKVFKSGEKVIAEDAEHHADLTGPFTYMERVKSAAGVPLITSQDSPVGVLFVNYRTPHTFSVEELAALEESATQVADVVQGWLTEDLLRELQALPGLQRQEAVLQVIADTVRDILRDVAVAIWMLDESRKNLVIKAHVGLREDYVRRTSLSLKKRNGVVDVFINKTPVNVADIAKERGFPDKSEAKRMRWKSALAIPMLYNSRVLGVFCVYRVEGYGFTANEERLINAFVERAAISYENEQRIVALNALHDVATRLTFTTLDSEHLLTEIARSACRVTGAHLASVLPYDPSSQEFYDADRIAVYGATQDVVMTKPRPRGGLSAHIVERGQIIIEDLDQEKNEIYKNTFISREGIKAYTGVRLRANEETMGILFVNFREPHHFTPDELSVTNILANYAATAIHNARIYGRARALLEQREALYEIAQDITSVLDTDELLHKILERSLELLKCDVGSIALWNRITGKIEYKYAIGKELGLGLSLGEGLIGAAAQRRKPVRVEDVTRDRRYVKHVPATRSELDVPMIVGDKLIGVLNFESSQYDAFNQDDEDLAVALANQAAIALENARLFEGTQERLESRLEDIKALQGIYEAINTKSLSEVVDLIVKTAMSLTPAMSVALRLLDDERKELHLQAVVGRGVPPEKRTRPITVDEHSINGWVVLTKEPYLCTDVESDPHYMPWYDDVQCELVAPLVYQERVTGTLDLQSTLPNAFNEDHLRLVEAMAGQAAIAIEAANLYYRRLKDLKALDDFGRALTGGIRLKREEILELIHEQASKLIDTGNMYIALYDEATDTVSFGLAFVNGERVDVEKDPGWQPRQAGRGRTEAIIRTKQPTLHKTRQETEEWYAQPGHEEYLSVATWGSWIGVPMVAGEKALGVIAAYNTEREYVYDEVDRQVLSTMASQAAIALDNADLYYRRLRDLEALNDIGRALTAGIRLEQHEILELIHEQTSKLIDTGNMYIALYDEATDTVSFGLAFVDGVRVDVEKDPGWQPRQAGRGRTEEIIRTRKPILIRMEKEAEDWYEQPGREEYTRVGYWPSWIGVPMATGEKVLGVIAAYNTEREYVYDEVDRQVLSTMASQAAIALDNARLLEQSELEVEMLTSLQEINRAIGL